MFNFFNKSKDELWKPGTSDIKISEPYLTFASYLGLYQNHLLEIQSIQPLLSQKIEEITDIHYDFISATPNLMDIVTKHSNIPKLKETFREYLRTTFEANINETYIKNREKIGRVHFIIGLSPEWYIASQMRILNFLSIFLHENLKRSRFLFSLESIQKLLGFDTQIILKIYSESYVYQMNSNLCDAVDKTADSKNLQHAFQIVEKIKEVTTKTEFTKVELEKSSTETKKLNTQLETISQEINSSIQEVESSKKLVSDALYSIEEISYKYGELMANWTQLNQEIEKIRNVISIIQDIAERTNLLSLNASIEAARAGKEGAGFAVVSSEINKLSTQTAESVQSITQLVKNIVKTVSNINSDTNGIKNLIKERVKQGFEAVDSFEDLTKLIRLTNDKISNFKENFQISLETISESTKKMFDMLYLQTDLRDLSIENTRNMLQYTEDVNELRKKNLATLSQIPIKVMIRTVKTEHRLWKWWLFSFMFDIHNLTEEQILDHTQCRLGKWYYSIDNPQITQLKSYKEMEAPHARLHSIAKEIFWSIKDKKFEEAKEKLVELEKLSTEIIACLDRLEKEIEGIII